MPLYRSSVRALAGFQGNHYASPRVFGAKGNGVADDTAAIQSAINTLKVLPGGGTVVMDGLYRITAALAMDVRVSFEGVGSGMALNGGSALLVDHPTANIMEWTNNVSGYGYVKQRISNLLLGAKQSNTGFAMAQGSSSPVDLVLDNITYNEGPIAGLQSGGFFAPAAVSKLLLNNCTLNQVGNGVPLFLFGQVDGALTFNSCRLAAPNGNGARMVDMQAGRLGVFGCDFLAGSSPSGSAAFLHTGALGSTRAVGNTFRATGGAMPAFTWASGAQLVEGKNTYEGSSAVFSTLTGTPAVLAAGSRIEPRLNYKRTSSSDLWEIDDYVENFSWNATGLTAVTLVLPKLFVPGQPLRVTVYNATGSNLTITFSPGLPQAAISNGKYATYNFVASDLVSTGTFSWRILENMYQP